jgi:hypothetical protein
MKDYIWIILLVLATVGGLVQIFLAFLLLHQL